jgi:hypothetical protein
MTGMPEGRSGLRFCLGSSLPPVFRFVPETSLTWLFNSTNGYERDVPGYIRLVINAGCGYEHVYGGGITPLKLNSSARPRYAFGT